MTVPLATEVVALRTELETLRANIAALESQLLGAQHALDMTMRNQLRCGLAEWWVKDPGGLEPHADYLEILDGDTADAGTPYR